MNGTQLAGGKVFGNLAANWVVQDGSGDYNGDGNTDVLWRDTATGDIATWIMDGGRIAGGGIFTYGVANDIQIQNGSGDFNGDGKSDVLLRNNTTGDVTVWLMNGSAIAGPPGAVPSIASNWVIQGAGDYNGDGKSDILWRDADTGDVAFWLMDGTRLAGGKVFGSLPATWVILDAAGDYNGDGKSDILWQKTDTGDVATWIMDGGRIAGGGIFGNVSADWHIG
jgi:hypothetical protein